MAKFWNSYGKLITAILGLILTSLAGVYGSASWWPIVTTIATGLGVYFAPHVSSP
jgi:hypothetical protein